MSISHQSQNKPNALADFLKITLLFAGCIVGSAAIMRVVGWMVGAA